MRMFLDWIFIHFKKKNLFFEQQIEKKKNNRYSIGYLWCLFFVKSF
jgi:hypothetical protein